MAVELSNFVVDIHASVYESMSRIDRSARGIAFVCDGEKMVGTVTDGDIRRYILNGGSLDAPVERIVNRQYTFVTPSTVYCSEHLFSKYKFSALPVVDDQGRLTSIRFQDVVVAAPLEILNLPVVIMAGGKGTRLHPYTEILPKPLIPVGDKTITELIIDRFQAYGCSDFQMIVNYKKNLIKAYFQDGEPRYNITFWDEQEYLGTGGGLHLIQGKISGSFFMTNCDTLVNADYGDILRHHRKQGNLATMVCAIKKVTIPYGTVELDDHGRAQRILEKPGFNFLTNVGLYLLEPDFLERIPKDTCIHITDILAQCIKDGERIGVYPVDENAWMDMGQFEELERMRELLEKQI